jgi:hypothetical protein
MKIRPVGAQLLHAGRRVGEQTDVQTHVTKLIVTFRKFFESAWKKLKTKE